MQDFVGKVAVVTGGASGIGLAIAQRLASEGCKLVVADIEANALEQAVEALQKQGAEASGVRTDVSDAASVEALAQRAFELHGAVDILCNNAGVGTDETALRMWELPLADWQWVFSVNVWGVLHGIRAFLPRMIAQDREAHVVNTSSGNGGLTLVPTTPIYSASKSTVTTMTETLHQQLLMTGSKVKASVLFPGPSIVDTNIFSAERNRPEDQRETPWTGPSVTLEDIQRMAKQAGHDLVATRPEQVAEHLLDGLRNDRFWILPASADTEAKVRARADGILARKNPQLSF